MKGTSIQWINYGADEDQEDQYNSTLLIGPIGVEFEKESIPLSEALEMVENPSFDRESFYTDIIIAHENGPDV